MKQTREFLVGLFLVLVCTGLLLVAYNHSLATSRARECSHILHGFSAGTLTPLTNDASEEIGACLLQFGQPLVGGDE